MGKAGDYFRSMGNSVLGALSGAASGGIAGAVGGGFSALTSSLFGPSVKKQIKWQKQAQMELNQQAADLNYEYGEKAAQNAYDRQMAMYERSYEDQSYKAMRQQMEDAGLSVGLMYGSGASGGGAGSMSGAPQGATGGAVAGDASAGIALALEAEKIRLQKMQVNADVNLKNAEAESARASAEKSGEESETTRQMRAVQKELLKQQGMKEWIANIRNKWQDMEYLLNEDGEPEDYVTEHELYGTYAILGKSLNNQSAIAAANAAVLEVDNLAAINDKIREEIKAITQSILVGKAEEALARAKKLQTDAATKDIRLKNGEETNWRTWLDIGFKSVETLCRLASTAGGFIGFGKVAKFLKGQAKRRNGGIVPREYEDILDGINRLD